MKTKYFVVLSIFYLQPTMSDPVKNKLRRRYFPATRSGFHGYHSYRRRAAGGGYTLPPGMTWPPGKDGKSDLPNDMVLPENMFDITEEPPSTLWEPQAAYRVNMTEQCDYIAHYCLKAYTTGEVCGRTILYSYYTFKNYCMLDYVNCMRQFDAWMLVHMGKCFNITFPADYIPPDRGIGADLDGELIKNVVLDRVAELQINKRITDDY